MSINPFNFILMTKIKKLSELKISAGLSESESIRVLGGGVGPECSFSTVLSGNWPDKIQTSIQPDSSRCGCGGFSYEDGGAGFALGMALTRTDGPKCNWNAIF